MSSSSPPRPLSASTSNSNRAEDSPDTNSSRASQLSAFSQYSYEELTRRVFYKPEGEDESGRVRPYIPELAEESSNTRSISQVLPPVAVVPAPIPKARDKGDGLPHDQDERPVSRVSATTATSPPASSAHGLHEQDPPPSTPMTTPTPQLHHDLAGAKPREMGSSPRQTASSDPKEPGSSVHPIPDATSYPRVKLSPPPKGKKAANNTNSSGSSPQSSSSSAPRFSDIPTIPSGTPSPNRRFSAPVLVDVTPSRHVRFRSELDIASAIGTPSDNSSESTPTAGRFVLPVAPPKSPVIERTMFIVGFLFPWCWLIGGWLVPLASRTSPACVPSLERLRKNTRSRNLAQHLLPVHSQSQPIIDTQRSYSLTLSHNNIATPNSDRNARAAKRARWARRCRIAATGAAVAIGVIIGIAVYGAVSSR